MDYQVHFCSFICVMVQRCDDTPLTAVMFSQCFRSQLNLLCESEKCNQMYVVCPKQWQKTTA